MSDELIPLIAKTMDLSEAEVRAVIDKFNNTPQPCYHHGPIPGVCKSTRCSECKVLKGE